ncbi:MAG: hypothetical protein KAJ19_09605 [Gammaproteobacteria bacterium]|nr:hypothetical protein [Gammaproteobacteria bacterium]
MAITNTKTVANVLARGGGAFVSDDDGTTYYDLGRVKSTMFDFTVVETEADTAGRTVQLAADIVLTTILTQTGNTELLNLDDLAAQATNGLWLKFTSIFTNAAGAGAADGYTFKNVFPTFAGSIKFDNTESGITMVVKGRVNMADLAGLGTTQDLTFDG